MSATIGTKQPVPSEFRHDVLQIRRVLDRRRGDADELATDSNEIERLFDGFSGVHRVAGEHGLLHDGMVAPDDDPPCAGSPMTTSRVFRR